MNKILISIILTFLIIGCSKKNNRLVDVSNINVDVKIKRFEQIFYNANATKLPAIKKEFSSLFPHAVKDSVWISKMKDTTELELFNASQKVFLDFESETKQLEDLFKHVKYYYPKFSEPEVITLISNIPVEQKVALDNDKLYISLDVFLGIDNIFYGDYPKYIKQNLIKEQLIVETARALALKTQFNSLDRTFISKIIQRGKLYYTIASFLPHVKEEEILGFTKNKFEWSMLNKELIWRYFVDKKLFYETDTKLDRRFIEEAPFSKFYLDIDTKSPGRIGEWLGYQIVKSYVENNSVDLKTLLKEKNNIIFKKSGYNPKK